MCMESELHCRKLFLCESEALTTAGSMSADYANHLFHPF